MAASFLAMLESNNHVQLAELTEKIRKFVSKTENPPLADLVCTGLIPHFVEFLEPKYYEDEKLVTESSHILANVASGNAKYVDLIVNLGIVPKAIELLEYPSDEIKDNALFMLANIAAESFQSRDLILDNKIVPTIINLLCGETHTKTLINNVAWLIANLTRGRPYPYFRKVVFLLTKYSQCV